MVSDNDLMSQKWCDIIFKGRNRKYGAYKIRTTSSNRLLIALLTTFLFTSLIALFPFVQTAIEATGNSSNGFTESVVLADLKEITGTEEEEKENIIHQEDPPTLPATKQQIKSADITIVGNNKKTKNEYEVSDPLKAVAEITEVFVVPVSVSNEEKEEEEVVFALVESMPAFPGGDEKMIKYFRDNIRYPQTAREKGLTGKVLVGFIVEKDGTISNIKVYQDIGDGCAAEAIRVVKSMPHWEPGKQNGEYVRVEVRMPIAFNLY